MQVGEKLLAFDEHLTNKIGRYLRFAEVQHNAIEEAECVGIRLEDGQVLYCTPDHSWLVKMAASQLQWREARDLAETSKHGPVYLPKIFGDCWTPEGLTYEEGYIAAAFDGEGSLDRTNSIIFSQVENSMMARMEHYLSSRGYTYKKSLKSSKSSVGYKSERQPCYDLRLHGMKVIARVLGGYKCTRLLEKLKANLNKKPQRMRCLPEDMVRVVEVFPAGKRKVAVLQTSTATHFTGGFPSHNTYARRLNDDDPNSPTEEWPDTVERVVTAANEQLACGFTDDELGRLRGYLTRLKGTVAGRFLWQLGTPFVSQRGLASLQNCAFTTVDHPVRPFTWAFDMLMLGSGVGYNIQREYVYKLPPVSETFNAPRRMDTASADFIVPDTREGWVELLHRTLESAFQSDRRSGFTYSTQLVRGKGAPIKGFGGTASGPEDLVWGIGQISGILEKRRGKQLRPIDCLDIMNIIGHVVVAGNVRRSAQIAIGDHDDIQFLKAKRWDLGNIPNWRAMSNNSVVCNNFALLPQEFWEGYRGNGEPYGLINLKLARACGRTGDTRYRDKRVRGFNPCAEQSLEDYETCCLAEIFLPNIESYAELVDVAKLLYRVNKHSLALPCHHPETERVVHANMRMGIGVTGYLQCTPEQKSWLRDCYEELREYDAEYSKERGWPISIKLTTTKPSGTLSLLPGVTAGCHPAFSRFLIRRIRIASDHPLVDVCRRHGYRVEPQLALDGTADHSTMVVEFPFRYPDNAVLAEETTAIDQLEVVRELQTNWSDNAVSCTVYYRPEELDEIREYLKKNYNRNFKSLSFLLHSGHGFVQAPLEAITEDRYNELKAATRVITSVAEAEFVSDDECAGGVCPVK